MENPQKLLQVKWYNVSEVPASKRKPLFPHYKNITLVEVSDFFFLFLFKFKSAGNLLKGLIYKC